MKKALARGLSDRLEEYGLGFAKPVNLEGLSEWDAGETILVSSQASAETELSVVYSPTPLGF